MHTINHGVNMIKGTATATMMDEWILEIGAGSGSKTEAEIDQLGENFNTFLRESIENSEKAFLQKWNRISDSAQGSDMLHSLALRLEPELFFRFGQLLIKKIQKSQDDNIISAIHYYLNFLRQSSFLKQIYGQERWEQLTHLLILESNFTLLHLFRQRLSEHPRKSLFKVITANSVTDYNWQTIAQKVQSFKKGLLALTCNEDEKPAKVAFLMENSLEMALLDLACLTGGIVDIMIAANSVPQHIDFILNQTRAKILLVSNDKQLAKVKSIRKNLKHLEKVVLLRGSSIEEWVISLKEMLKAGDDIEDDFVERIEQKININSLATIMYTSGTTGDPKGIMFSQMNLVYKRFCRAMALPEIGSHDRFLSFLPLFHTFGRYLEMLGAIFWGAEYCFMENPAMETMLDNMKRVKPTVFISIPKKWYELYNAVTSRVDIEFDDPDDIRQAVKSVSGGKLKWGLSAAGFLEPDIFRFFQANGVELLSGFGMTEATGGITMTPPGQYIENSLGKPLPGIEVKLGDDGEMLIRGPYVMISYYDGNDDVEKDPEYWMPTGDIMKTDSNGFYEIIDRKKEIYKNIKGETIAPQKIENYFRDFEYVKQVFLVGDHKQYNTVLIYPDPEKEIVQQMNPQEKQDYFSTFVVTVNKFLAPFERIIDFRLIDRPFTEKDGELTPKGTYKRRIIERNFDTIIQTMYSTNYISLSWINREIRIPNWFLREKGCLTHDISVEKDGLYIEKYKQHLNIKSDSKNNTKIIIGNYVYYNPLEFVDFQIILNNPLYWLGNFDIVTFTGSSIYQWYRLDTTDNRMHFHSIVSYQKVPDDLIHRFYSISEGEEYSLEGLHLAVLMFQSGEYELQEKAVAYIKFILADDSLPLFNLARDVVSRPGLADDTAARRLLFTAGLGYFNGQDFEKYLLSYLQSDINILGEKTIPQIVKLAKGDENLMAIYRVLKQEINKLNGQKMPEHSVIPALFDLMAEYGIHHPIRYKKIRQLIVRYQLFEHMPDLVVTARIARIKLLNGFRDWLGSNQPVAVDVETGQEYEWVDVIAFEKEISNSDKNKILAAISETSLVREAIFLLSNGSMVRLYDIPPGGMWVSLVDESDTTSFFRVSVQTRFQGAYDFVLCLNRRQEHDQLRDEINWLIHISTEKSGENLVDNFGGYWQEYQMWTKEYFPSLALSKFIERDFRKQREESEKRLFFLWPFFIWSATWAHVRFWKRTGYKTELKDKSTRNIIIPSHDYQTGIKLISIEERIKSKGIKHLLLDLYDQFILATQNEHKVLTQDSIWFYIFSAVLHSEGEEKGVELVNSIISENGKDEIGREAAKYLENYNRYGYLPKRLYFAIRRFERWKIINDDAALSAQARSLNEFYETYHLADLEKVYPETRTNFFLHTVFADSAPEIRNALLNIVQKQHDANYSQEGTLALLSVLQKEFELNEKEAFFLARLSYPHLKPTDTVEFISTQAAGEQVADVVIRLEDYDGEYYMVRRPVSPKEISRLHQLFMEAQLPVNFRQEHRFMVVVSERGHIIGGLFYSNIDPRTVYMEKIVVSNRYRRKGISEGLMHEFFNRMRGEHVETVTTAFLRPEYFYRFGFKVERKYSGLVKDLRVQDSKA
ncbi:MAG: GNAT family N-acetyltransferase [Calditrichae bacterium]|nr:GNAT family N-acetyltransferase [Calditrichota bacterium]MCB9058094.1 GNAT family N-acetyltransferase [Calditrichia bacterium]